MRSPLLLLWLLLASFGAWSEAWSEEPPGFAAAGKPFVKKHCERCHGGKEPAAGLSLAAFTDYASVVPQRKRWMQVLKMVRSGSMPPEDEPQPSDVEVQRFLAHMDALFDYADRHAKPDPGRVTMRRLNRTEYRNTVRDLFDVDFDPTEGFPADDIGHGFDNIGDVLTLSPLLMERYLDAAESISRRVIVVNPPKPAVRYLAGRFLQPNNAQTPQGRFRKMDPASEDPTQTGPFSGPGSYFKFSADADLIFRATIYAEMQGDAPVKVALFINGRDIDPSSDEERARLLGADQPRWKSIRILKTFEITARDADNRQTIEVPVSRMGGINNAGIALLKPPEGEPLPTLFVEHLWSEGPLETRPASQQKILACSPHKSQTEQTEEVLQRLLLRAYRRPPSAGELQRMTAFVQQVMDGGAKWEAAIQQVVEIVLCSPKFLFRAELDKDVHSAAAGKPRDLDQFQLASRMSYFLWSSMPDDELFAAATKGQLQAGLSQQVTRMLNDPKASALVENFAVQWLQIQRLEQVAPDARRFPTFNDPLRRAMLGETKAFFESVVREDRSILDLLDADYTFLNEPLARHYGIADTQGNPVGKKPTREGGAKIRGEQFQRVALQDGTRGGLLTHASVLTVTSNPTRTSPVKRGRWVLEQILGEPPPPPPPNVPELEEDDKAVTGKTLRERLEQHRAKPSCANCHAKMDPIGFALENYNAIGAFRTEQDGSPIDAAGEFADGAKFDGPADLKSIIRGQSTQFSRCLTEKLLTYALGRGLEYYDRPAVEEIIRQLKAGEYRFSVLVAEIIKSDPFRQRRGDTTQRK